MQCILMQQKRNENKTKKSAQQTLEQQTKIKSLTRLKAINMTSVRERETHGILNVFWYRFRMTRSTNVYSKVIANLNKATFFFKWNLKLMRVCALSSSSTWTWMLWFSMVQILLKTEHKHTKIDAKPRQKEIKWRKSTLQWHKHRLYTVSDWKIE